MPHPNQKLIDAMHLNKVVIFRAPGSTWRDMDKSAGPMVWQSLIHADGAFEFMIKPKMIKLGDVEVVAPLRTVEPNEGIYILESDGNTFFASFDPKDTLHQELLKSNALFASARNADAFHQAFNKYIDSQC